jgi:hypothetical protein
LPTGDAVAIRRELAAADPDQHRADLARADNLSVTLSNLSRLEDDADRVSAGNCGRSCGRFS